MMSSDFKAKRNLCLLLGIAVCCSGLAAEPEIPEMDSQSINSINESQLEEAGDSPMLDAIAASIGRILFGGGGAFTGIVELVEEALDNMELADPPMDVEEVTEEFRRLLVMELSFVRLVCDELTVDQRAIVRAAAEASLKQSVRDLIAAPLTAHVVGVLKDQTPHPLPALRDAISNSLQQLLSEDRFRQYTEIAEARIAHRKQAAILGVVSAIDGLILLNSDQRDEIVQAFSTQWEPNWECWVFQIHLYQEDLPKFPDNIVINILNDSQRSVWEMIRRYDFVDWEDEESDELFNDGWWGEVMPDDNPFENNDALEKILGN